MKVNYIATQEPLLSVLISVDDLVSLNKLVQAHAESSYFKRRMKRAVLQASELMKYEASVLHTEGSDPADTEMSVVRSA